MDLWNLLVVNMFQSFWLAVLGLCALFWIIFVIGRVSQVTIFNFITIFILAMAMGYGFSLISILITILILVLNLLAIPRLVNS